MTADYPPAYAAATPEYVLNLFRDVFRAWGQPEESVTHGMPVAHFAEEVNDTICRWRELVPFLNEVTQLGLPPVEWAPVVSPMSARTVGDVCRFAARRMSPRPVVRPWPHAAGECFPAGAFLTARALLVRLGARASAVTPSTPIREYLLRFGPGWVFDLARMAPGRLPPVEVRYALQSCGQAGTVLGLGLLLAGSAFGAAAAVFGCEAAVCFTTAVGTGLLNGRLPVRARVGDLVTFRDLAYALAGQEPRRRIQTTA